VELFGRENDLAEVAARLTRGHRLVTVTGPGGVGKTSVARAVMARLESTFPLGGHLVDLSRIDRPDAVGGELAAVVGRLRVSPSQHRRPRRHARRHRR
jgi:predicted ATPase